VLLLRPARAALNEQRQRALDAALMAAEDDESRAVRSALALAAVEAAARERVRLVAMHAAARGAILNDASVGARSRAHACDPGFPPPPFPASLPAMPVPTPCRPRSPPPCVRPSPSAARRQTRAYERLCSDRAAMATEDSVSREEERRYRAYLYHRQQLADVAFQPFQPYFVEDGVCPPRPPPRTLPLPCIMCSLHLAWSQCARSLAVTLAWGPSLILSSVIIPPRS
jgi:hypothetical protein